MGFFGIKRTTINHMLQRKIIHNFKNVISKKFLIRENAIVYNELLTSNIPQQLKLTNSLARRIMFMMKKLCWENTIISRFNI